MSCKTRQALSPSPFNSSYWPEKSLWRSGAMGGTSGLKCGYGAQEQTPNLCGHKCTAAKDERSNSSGCSLQCDAQSCDPCHPNDQGYTVLAATIMAGIGL